MGRECVWAREPWLVNSTSRCCVHSTEPEGGAPGSRASGLAHSAMQSVARPCRVLVRGSSSSSSRWARRYSGPEGGGAPKPAGACARGGAGGERASVCVRARAFAATHSLLGPLVTQQALQGWAAQRSRSPTRPECLPQWARWARAVSARRRRLGWGGVPARCPVLRAHQSRSCSNPPPHPNCRCFPAPPPPTPPPPPPLHPPRSGWRRAGGRGGGVRGFQDGLLGGLRVGAQPASQRGAGRRQQRQQQGRRTERRRGGGRRVGARGAHFAGCLPPPRVCDARSHARSSSRGRQMRGGAAAAMAVAALRRVSRRRNARPRARACFWAQSTRSETSPRSLVAPPPPPQPPPPRGDTPQPQPQPPWPRCRRSACWATPPRVRRPLHPAQGWGVG